MHRSSRLSLLLALIVASCATPPKPAPGPPPPPPRVFTSPPAHADWRDLPETRGNWRYSAEADGSAARFGEAGVVMVTLRCAIGTRRVSLIRAGAAGAALKITTSYGDRTLAAPDLSVSDPLLDQIAFSRGRFTIETPGLPELVLPAWAEPARVIEDCRG